MKTEIGTSNSVPSDRVMTATNTDLADTLRVLRRQEDQVYYRKDQEDVYQTSAPLLNPQDVDVECRVKMAEWMTQVVDFCEFHRDTVAIALNYMDRYLQDHEHNGAIKCPARHNRKLFQLASMTCLYSAIKTHEPEAMEPRTIAGLSQGAYSVQDVENMEMSICMRLGWYLNPPTAKTFLSYFQELLKEDESCRITEQWDELEYQVELASSYLVHVKPSTVAFCALANVGGLDDATLKSIIRLASIDMKEAINTQDTLWELLQQVQEQQPGEEIIAILPRNGSVKVTHSRRRTTRQTTAATSKKKNRSRSSKQDNPCSRSPRCVSSR